MITNLSQTLTPMESSRLGFHYFPDSLHYREVDLQTWLPELQAMGASWLVIRSEVDRAVPEYFLRGLKRAGIEPVIQFQFNLDCLPNLKEISTLLEVYARWGARYLIFFDRPNIRAAWPSTGWVQQDLVERFLDRFLPVANLAMKMGMIPVFPPLEPGGSYWDTAFLRSALEAIQRRKQEQLLGSLVLSAYAWTGSRSLNWGAGGPERWPTARPYMMQLEGQDQRGFRIYDWYQAVARSVLMHDCPVILLQAGLPGDPMTIKPEALSSAEYVQAGQHITRLLAGEQVQDPLDDETVLEPIPAQVIACNYWLLAAEPSSAFHQQAWFQSEGSKHALVRTTRAWHSNWMSAQMQKTVVNTVSTSPAVAERPIRHYLLLPGHEWGVSDWYLEVIRPFVKKHRPTIGFSPEEAERAVRVTVVGNGQNFPEDLFVRLQKAGCWVEQISGDGINIATELAER
jgi:hypothetical protein